MSTKYGNWPYLYSVLHDRTRRFGVGITPIFGEEVMRGTAACLNMGTSPTYVSARRKAGCDTPDLAARKCFVHPNVGIQTLKKRGRSAPENINEINGLTRVVECGHRINHLHAIGYPLKNFSPVLCDAYCFSYRSTSCSASSSSDISAARSTIPAAGLRLARR